MMPITKSLTPNEFLVRWSDAGQIQGAHIVFRETVIEDGTELTSRLLPAQPVALAGASGFPLSDVLAEVQASALATIEARDAEIAALKSSQQAIEAERDAALTRAAELQAQLDAIHSPEPEPNASAVPQVVSAFQAKAALMQAGLYDAINAALTSPEAPPLARLAWETARDFERGSPTVAGIGAQFGLTDAQLDALFTSAAQIKA